MYNQLSSCLSMKYCSNERVRQFQYSGYSTFALMKLKSHLQGHLGHLITTYVTDYYNYLHNQNYFHQPINYYESIYVCQRIPFSPETNINENAERFKSKGLSLWLRRCFVSTCNKVTINTLTSKCH